MKKLTHNILYLDRQKLVFCSSGLSAPLTLDVPLSIFFDMEVIDPEAFDNLLSDWIEKNELQSNDVLVILSSSVYFQKNYPATNDDSQKKSRLDAFLKNIPYKNLFNRDYFFGNETEIIAVNKDFYEPIIRCLEKYHLNVVAIIPTLVLDRFQLQLGSYGSKEVKDIYQKYKQLEPYSLISAKEISKNLSVNTHHPVADKKRTYILAAIFCFLWVVLLAFLFVRPYLYKQQLSKTMVKVNFAAPVADNISPTPIPLSPTATPTTTYLSIAETKIKITNDSGVSKQAGKIKDALTALGFVQINIATGSQISGEKNQIYFTPSVSPEVVQEMARAVEMVSGPTLTKAVPSLSDADISVTTVAKP